MELEDAMLAEKKVLEGKYRVALHKYDTMAFPEGRLQINKNGKNGYKFYHVIENGKAVDRTYIKKNQIELAKQLAEKKYLEKTIRSIKMEIDAIDAYLKRIPKDTPDKMIRSDEIYRKLLGFSATYYESADKWSKEEYEKSDSHPENLKIVTLKGDLVRSKAEAMIADALYRNGIPYRYECKLELKNETFYPDFTVKNKRTGKIHIWEHFGLIDKADYLNSFLYKSKKYIENGYIPTINLIETFETEDKPLDSIRIDEIIKMYLI